MSLTKFQYLLKVQFLGIRFHGYQKQKNAKAVQEFLDKAIENTLIKSLKETLVDNLDIHSSSNALKFKTFPASRTDSGVSANNFLILLTVNKQLNSTTGFLEMLNSHLPLDIKALELTEHFKKINIIGDIKEKTYYYYFCYGQRPHPFSAPFLSYFKDDLNIDLMQQALRAFHGVKNYKHFTFRPNQQKNFERELKEIALGLNTKLSASFFPKESYLLTVRGKGFLRHQIRLIMGALVNIGSKKISLQELEDSLAPNYGGARVNFIAPSNGLCLEDFKF